MRHASNLVMSVLAISTLALVACGTDPQFVDESPPPAGIMPVPEIRDSAGVRIVEYGSLAGTDTTAWRVVMDGSVRIGRPDDDERDSPYQFGSPAGIARLAAGSVAVADRHAHQVRVFAANGRFERSIGRRGEGPGEFTVITGVHTIGGDSLVVTEGYRWSVFDEAGTHVRSGRLAPEGITFPEIVEVFADGTLLVAHRRRRSEAPTHPWGGEARGTVDYSRFGGDGEFVSSFGTFPVPVRLTVSLDSPSSLGTLPTAGLTPLPASGPRVAGTRFYWAPAGLSEVHVFESEGTHREGVRKMILRFGESALPGTRGTPSCPGSLAFPEMFSRDVVVRFCEIREELGPPIFSAFLVDDSGNIWLREPSSGPENPEQWTRWYVFDPDGLVVARVSLPRGWDVGLVRLVRIGTDHILAGERDDLGVETFVLVPLVKQ